MGCCKTELLPDNWRVYFGTWLLTFVSALACWHFTDVWRELLDYYELQESTEGLASLCCYSALCKRWRLGGVWIHTGSPQRSKYTLVCMCSADVWLMRVEGLMCCWMNCEALSLTGDLVRCMTSVSFLCKPADSLCAAGFVWQHIPAACTLSYKYRPAKPNRYKYSFIPRLLLCNRKRWHWLSLANKVNTV